MSKIMRVAALAAAVLAGFAQPLTAAPEKKPAAPDDFVRACVARGKSSPDRCACESKLARASLDAGERAAMIRGIAGDGQGFQAALAKMSEAKRQSFATKMQQLQARSAAQCR